MKLQTAVAVKAYFLGNAIEAGIVEIAVQGEYNVVVDTENVKYTIKNDSRVAELRRIVENAQGV